MNTIQDSNYINTGAGVPLDPGWVQSFAAQQSQALYTENTDHRIGVFYGRLLPRLSALEPNKFYSVTDGTDSDGSAILIRETTVTYNLENPEIMDFHFDMPSSLRDVKSIKIDRITVYGNQDVEGTQVKLTSECSSDLAGEVVNTELSSIRRRYHFTHNVLYVAIAGVQHQIEIFDRNVLYWLTMEELLDHLVQKIVDYVTPYDANFICGVGIGESSGNIELFWQSSVSFRVYKNVAIGKHNNIFRTIFDLFFEQRFRTNVVDFSRGLTNGAVLEIYPIPSANSSFQCLEGAPVIFFSSPTLAKYAKMESIVTNGPVDTIAVGCVSRDIINDADLIFKGKAIDCKIQDGSLVSSKISFDNLVTEDGFEIRMSIPVRSDDLASASSDSAQPGHTVKPIELYIRDAYENSRMQMLLFCTIY